MSRAIEICAFGIKCRFFQSDNTKRCPRVHLNICMFHAFNNCVFDKCNRSHDFNTLKSVKGTKNGKETGELIIGYRGNIYYTKIGIFHKNQYNKHISNSSDKYDSDRTNRSWRKLDETDLSLGVDSDNGENCRCGDGSDDDHDVKQDQLQITSPELSPIVSSKLGQNILGQNILGQNIPDLTLSENESDDIEIINPFIVIGSAK